MNYITFDESNEEKLQPETKENGIKKDFFDWLDIIVASIIAVVIIFTFFFRVVTIVGDSMQNTFFGGEKIIITDLFYTPKYGDVIVVSRNANNTAEGSVVSNEPIIKRVIATGGQYVDIDFDSGKVYVGYSSNRSEMTELHEPYVKAPTYFKADVEFPTYVPEGYVFVLGDNRNDSKDSRFSEIGENGLINEKYILGKAIFRIFPFNKMGTIPDVDGGVK